MPGDLVIALPGLSVFHPAPILQQLLRFNLLSHERKHAEEREGSKPKWEGAQEQGGKERSDSLNKNLAVALSFSTLAQHGA